MTRLWRSTVFYAVLCAAVVAHPACGEEPRSPYKPLLDAGVKFYATRGNHDVGDQWLYPAFNTEGHRSFTVEKSEGVLEPLLGGKVRFFAVDTVLLDQEQIDWLDRELAKTGADWKICFFHHPLYTSGRYSWSGVWRRRNLEPILVSHGVDVVFSGHEHLYERLVPQRGIVYFVSGGAGSVRVGDLSPSALTAKGFDRDLHFILVEIAGDTLYFQAISRTGEIIDSGRITKKKDDGRT